MAIIRKQTTTNYGEDAGKKNPHMLFLGISINSVTVEVSL
jgi:hypothetical protein